MANMVALQRVVLSSTASSVTFANIDQSYKDLYIVATIKGVSGTSSGTFRINNDLQSAYSWNYCYASSSVSGSNRNTGDNKGIYANWFTSISSTNYTTALIHIPRYALGQGNKLVHYRSGNIGENEMGTSIYRCNNNTVLSSIQFFTPSDSYAAGSSWTLYGI